MIQWHPLFAQLLRPLVEGYYEIQTDLAVGDAPRLADIVLLRRTIGRRSPFHGLWKHLTTWNVLEFKGPTVSPRRGDLIRLLELGLGIHRRLNEDRTRQRRPRVAADEVSFWYLAHHLGRRFLRSASTELDVPIEAWEPGIWRCRVLRHLVYLVSGADRPVERDSLPLHVLGRESTETEVAVARVVREEPSLWDVYGPWIASFHPTALEVLQAMARIAQREFQPDWEGLIRLYGLEAIISRIGIDRVIEQVGLDRVIEQVGLKRVVEELGPKRIVEELGPKRVVEELGPDRFLAQLTPAQRRELKRRLKE